MPLLSDFPTTHQCLQRLADNEKLEPFHGNSLVTEDVPFEKRTCKELTSLLRRNALNLSELILFYDGLYDHASRIILEKELNSETSALFNFLFMQFTKSDFWTVGPLKVHGGFVSKFPQRKDSEVHELIVELLRLKTELRMLIDGSLSQKCAQKFDKVLQPNTGTGSGDVGDDATSNANLKETALERFSTLSAQREHEKRLHIPKTCSDCHEPPELYCRECNLFRCQRCSQKSHRNMKDKHREWTLTTVKALCEGTTKVNTSFNQAIYSEQSLAILINKNSPWKNETIGQGILEQQKMQAFRDLIAKDSHELSKTADDDEIIRSFQLACGDPQEALRIFKARRQKNVDMLKMASVEGNIPEKLMRANGNVTKVLVEMCDRQLRSASFKIGDDELRIILNNSQKDKLLRQRLAYVELFANLSMGCERARLLVEAIDHGNNKERVDENQNWWNDFVKIDFDEFVTTIKGLEELNYPALISSPILSEDCPICVCPTNKRSMYKYTCKCEPICNTCLMANMKVNLKEAGNQLKCFQDCFKDDKAAAEKEHTRLYSHLQEISRQNDSFREVFENFEKLVAQQAMESVANAFSCPHNACTNVWILDEPIPGERPKRRVKCPECEKLSCRKCKQVWKKEHKKISCSEYTKFLAKNFPDLVRVLEPETAFGDNPKIKCPNCKSIYFLDRGGCIHFTCDKCKFEFCGHCSKPFHKPSKNPCTTCQVGLGLHAHHPRNCPFYTRDYPIPTLKQLVTKSGKELDDLLPKNPSETDKCEVMETNEKHKEKPCPNEKVEDNQGYCAKHFVELLSGEIFKRKDIDPVDIMSIEQVRTLCDREDLEYEDGADLEAMREVVKKECPLEDD